MVAEKAISKSPATKKTLCHRETRFQSTTARITVNATATIVHLGAICFTANAMASALGDWYRNGRMIKAGMRNRHAPQSTQTVNMDIGTVLPHFLSA